MSNEAAKSRTVYIILAVLLGTLGIHNFYAGFTKKGIIQLVLTLLVGWLGVALLIWLWAIYEACTVKADSNGVAMV